MRVLCFGSMNLDYVYSVDHMVAPGETLASAERRVYVGGKGLNQAVAMARAGLPVWQAAVSGADGGMLTDFLAQNAVDISLIRHSAEISGHTVIQVDARGQNAILLYGGTNHRITEEYAAQVLSHFEAGDLIVLQNEINCLPQILAQAADRGLRIALNPSPFDGRVRACDLSAVSLFLVNEVEGAQMSGCAAQDPAGILRWFAASYPRAGAVLTLGSAGAWYQAEGKAVFQPAVPVHAVDTTAAGDTFTGYFLEGWLQGRPAQESLRRAAYAAALAVSRPGAAPSIPARTEVERALAEGIGTKF